MKEEIMQLTADSFTTLIKEQKADALLLLKLHSTLCFLMTRFHTDQCPKLAQFIVRHLGLVIDHPEVVDSPECQKLYIGLQQQWQSITAALLEPKQAISRTNSITH